MRYRPVEVLLSLHLPPTDWHGKPGESGGNRMRSRSAALFTLVRVIGVFAMLVSWVALTQGASAVGTGKSTPKVERHQDSTTIATGGDAGNAASGDATSGEGGAG